MYNNYFVVQQKLTQCKSIILQLNKLNKLNIVKRNTVYHISVLRQS